MLRLRPDEGHGHDGHDCHEEHGGGEFCQLVKLLQCLSDRLSRIRST